MHPTTSQFPIPPEFQSKIHHTGPLDTRPSSEILSSLSNHSPVTNEKNIWAYWHSGISGLPPWCKRNIINWSRRCGPSWNIHILDNIPTSPNYVLKWIPASYLPDSFVNNTMDGPYVGPHSADFLRGACLYLYGGVYLDVGIILIRSLDEVCWSKLEDQSSPFQVAVPWMYGSVIANHMVASRKGDPFIRAWHDLFVHLWKGKNSYDGVGQNPLVAFAQQLDFGESLKRGFAWDMVVDPFTVFQYIGQVLAWLRLCMIDGGDEEGAFDTAEYAAKHVLWFDSLEENWPAETVVGYKGQDLFDALAGKRDADKESDEYKVGYKLVWRMLAGASMQKVTHGKNLTRTPALGLLWDMEENYDKDIEEGTWSELLRYGSVHFQQSRETPMVDYKKPESVLHKGVFEP